MAFFEDGFLLASTVFKDRILLYDDTQSTTVEENHVVMERSIMAVYAAKTTKGLRILLKIALLAAPINLLD